VPRGRLRGGDPLLRLPSGALAPHPLDQRTRRLHGEIKRRTRAVGAFPDRASALRLVTAVALQVTAIWSDRRYLDMTLLKVKEVIVAKAA
jgi:Transposase, Mutator family